MDKSQYKRKKASQVQLVPREKEKLPVACYFAGTQTEEAGFYLETDIKEAKEQDEQANYVTVA